MFKGTKNAFTLAEVLITLGIIGVVAAMTMPTLMGSTQEAQYKTAFKKNMSVLSQALGIAVAKNGEDFSNTITATDINTVDKAIGYSGSLANALYEGLNRVNSSVSTKNTGTSIETIASGAKSAKGNAIDMYFYLSDGTAIYAASKDSGCIATAPCSVVIDTNGTKGPNLINKQGATSGKKNGYCKATSSSALYAKAPNGDAFKTAAMSGAGKPCTATQQISDQFEVLVYDSKVMPADSVGQFVFYGAK